MEKKAKLVSKLNDIILNFEETSNILNYAILIKDKIILSPSATYLTENIVLDILEKLNLEKLEEQFQKGTIRLLHIEFENDIIYYLKGTAIVRVIVTLQKDQTKSIREKLLKFVDEIDSIAEELSKIPQSEEEEKIKQAFAELESIIDGFEIPKFESFKRLVKFAVQFKKDS